MARKQIPPHPPATNPVDNFLARLDHPLVPLLQYLRALILDASPAIAECIKWNSPSFYVRDGAKDFATLNIHPRNKPEQYALLIFHQGAKVKDAATPAPAVNDPGGLLKWLAKDRCSMQFHTAPSQPATRAAIQDLIRQWIVQL